MLKPVCFQVTDEQVDMRSTPWRERARRPASAVYPEHPWYNDLGQRMTSQRRQEVREQIKRFELLVLKNPDRRPSMPPLAYTKETGKYGSWLSPIKQLGVDYQHDECILANEQDPPEKAQAVATFGKPTPPLRMWQLPSSGMAQARVHPPDERQKLRFAP